MATGTHHDGGRYGVTRYFDAFGAWYAVIDRQASSVSNIVRAARSRQSAHAIAQRMNADAERAGAKAQRAEQGDRPGRVAE